MVKTELKDWHPNILNSELTGKPMNNDLLHRTIKQIVDENDTDRAYEFLEAARKALAPILSADLGKRYDHLVNTTKDLVSPPFQKVMVEGFENRRRWELILKEYRELIQSHTSLDAIHILGEEYHYSPKTVEGIIYSKEE